MKHGIRQAIAMVLAVAIVTSSMIFSPLKTEAAEETAKIRLTIKTHDVTNAGTNDSIALTIHFLDGKSIKIHSMHYLDWYSNNSNAFERGQTDVMTIELTRAQAGDAFDDLRTPWMINALGFQIVDGWADGWLPEYIDCEIFFMGKWVRLDSRKPMSTGNQPLNNLTFGKHSGTEFVYLYARRSLWNLGGYDYWDSTEYIGVEDSGTMRKTWDGAIGDALETPYNVFAFADAPAMGMSTTNSLIPVQYENADPQHGSASISYNRAEVYNKMVEQRVGKVTWNVGLNFPRMTTPANNSFNKTITVYRKCYDLGREDITSSRTFVAPISGSNQKNYFFNNNYRDVAITMDVVSVHCDTNANASDKTTVLNNFRCDAKLYNGNNTSNLLCNMNITKENNKLKFTGRIPDNIDTGVNGLRLELSNINTGNLKYSLDDNTTNKSFYFSNYKADTKAPTFSVVDEESRPYSIRNNYKQFHKFWFTSAETLYGDAAVSPNKERYLNYSIYKKNADNTYASSPSSITNYNGAGNVTSVQIPVNTAIIKDTPTNLKLTYKNEEGVYKLKVTGYDKAGNPCSNSEIDNIIIDNKPPEISTEINHLNQAPDGSKSLSAKFTVNDLANSYKGLNAWSRVYYCFEEDGKPMPPVNESTAQSGTIDTVIGKWAFFEGGTDVNTAQLKVAKGNAFTGKLYFYGKDSVGNTGEISNRAIALRNDDAVDTIVFAESQYAKNSHDIRFDTSKPNIETTYYWTSKWAESFTQESKKYVATDNVGAAKHIDKSGVEQTFKGTYTLHYTVKNVVSGNAQTYERDFKFDNALPVVTFSWQTNNKNFLENQQANISITDSSGIEKASYKIVNYDGTDIAGISETALSVQTDADGITKVSLSPVITMATSGIYKLKISATDRNGEKIDGVVENGVFAIRAEKTAVTSFVDNIEKKLNGISLTQTDNYSLTATINEPMKNPGAIANVNGQTVKYRISADGINYTNWTAAEVALTAGTDCLQGSFNINTPVTLAEGNNNIFIQTIMTNASDPSVQSTKFASDAKRHQIIQDKTAPLFKVDYSKTSLTKDPVTATVTLSDSISGLYDGCFAIKNSAKTFEKVSDNQYNVIFTDSGSCTAIAKDYAGNAVEIPITVSNIDTEAPTVTVTATPVMDGIRKDADIEIHLSGVAEATVKFGIAATTPSEGTTLDPYETLSKLTTFSTEKVSETASATVPGEKNIVYKIHARGVNGTYVPVVYAQDILGNVLEKTMESSFTIEDAATAITAQACNPEITKSKTNATLTFNTAVAILPISEATEESDEKNMAKASVNPSKNFSTSFVMECSDKAEKKLFGVDKCGRTYTFTFTPNATFITGFDISKNLTLNGTAINFSGFYGFSGADTVNLEITPSTTYPGQYFLMDGSELVGFTLNTELSQIIVENAGKNIENPVQNPDGTAKTPEIPQITTPVKYSKLVFTASHNAASTRRSVKFKSYTPEGNEEDRTQEEYFAVTNLDETPATAEFSYSKTTPTSDNITATVKFSDVESGISKVEVDNGTGYVAEIGAFSPLTVVFNGNGTKHVRITNGANMEKIVELTVGNIDRTEIVENTDYTVKYLYQNYLGTWEEISADKYYRNVKAVVTKAAGSIKDLHVANNGNSFEKVLTPSENNFVFKLEDTSGHTADVNVKYELFDNEKGTTTWRLSNTAKTNKPVTAFVTISDTLNDVANSVVKDNEGKTYDWNTEVIGNEKSVNLPKSGIYTVTAYDAAGNMWTENITVSNIDTVLPTISEGKILYSTPQGQITAKSVNVTITEFSKANVRITKVEPTGTLTANDIAYVAGTNSVRFKKNGTVNVTFVDEYGNEGIDILTVSNIYSVKPTIRPILTIANDQLSVNITFEHETDDNGVPKDLYRALKDLNVSFGGNTATADKANYKINKNGDYTFTVFDMAGTTQELVVKVTGIDTSVPKITKVTWEYAYSELNGSEWTPKQESQTIVPKGEAGYVVGDDKYPITNKDVTVTVETDKPTKILGSGADYKNSATMLYYDNGLFNFNMQAKNGNSASYGVDIEVIDKKAPFIEFKSTPELVFIEGMTADKDPGYAYDKQKLYDYIAFDIRKGNKIDLTDKVTIDFGTFNPDDITKNKFDRTKPYYINYTVYDSAGNKTTVRRTIRLVGFYDTIAMINGTMPDSTNTASVKNSSFDISLENFGGFAYARYEKGIWTMGQMKNKGTSLVLRGGKYTLSNLTEGWYTVYIQTDKRDYFTIWVYVNPEV